MAHPMTKRIERNTAVVTETGCWIWLGVRDRAGYGRVAVIERGHSVAKLAHRESYKAFVGPITAGVPLLHACDTPACVNPAHLRIGTQQENLADMRSKGRDRGIGSVNRQKTHCNAGHPLSGENLRIEGRLKARRCRACETIKKGRKS